MQNFRAKPDTKRATAPEPDLDDLLWSIAAARLILPDDVHVQAPPNLSPGVYQKLIDAGIDDWGGVSPVTPDHVNPEAPWPQIEALAGRTAAMGKVLVQRLPVYPAYAFAADRWCAPDIATRVRRAIDAEGWAREDDWAPGLTVLPKQRAAMLDRIDPAVGNAVAKAVSGARLDEAEIVRLFAARDADYDHVITAADALRQSVSGETVRYVVNRNINYTNICYYRCRFCAFSKGKTHEALRGTPYDLALDEVVRRSQEAWDRGATEVCLQGGIHPDYTGATYLGICRAIKAGAAGHAHPRVLAAGGDAGRGDAWSVAARVPGAAQGCRPWHACRALRRRSSTTRCAAIICPDKVNTAQWLEVLRAAHGLGLRTTSTIMYGHVERPVSWARHLLVLRDLQAETGGITEFVPLPFVHMEAPMYLRGQARKGPTLREAVLMHAVARLALHPLITNIQTSWVKMGPDGAALCLNAGANDLGGTLMNESISRAAGTQHGQEFPPEAMEGLIRSIGRVRSSAIRCTAALRRSGALRRSTRRSWRRWCRRRHARCWRRSSAQDRSRSYRLIRINNIRLLSGGGVRLQCQISRSATRQALMQHRRSTQGDERGITPSSVA